MSTYIAKRLLLIVPTLFGAAALVFLIMRVIPGDVALLIFGGDAGGHIDPKQLAAMRARLGLDQPLWVQFGPSLWVGLLCVLLLVIFFGSGPPLELPPPWVDPWVNLQTMIWPVVTVGYRYAAVTTRMTRSTVLEVLREDYIRTAWAKGLQERA